MNERKYSWAHESMKDALSHGKLGPDALSPHQQYEDKRARENKKSSAKSEALKKKKEKSFLSGKGPVPTHKPGGIYRASDFT